MDAVDEIKATFVKLLETIPELAGSPNQPGRVYPELNDEYYNTYPAVALIVGGDNVKVSSRLPLSNEMVIDDRDPLAIVTGRELSNNDYPVRISIRAGTSEQKRNLADKILKTVLSVRSANADPGHPTGFCDMPNGSKCRIWFAGSHDWEDGNGEKKDGKTWKKVWVREITFTVNAAFIVEDLQTAFIVNEVIVNLFVNDDGLTENNGETITII